MNGCKFRSAIVIVLMGLLTGLLLAAPVFARRGGDQNENVRTTQGAPGAGQDENVPADRITIHQLKRMMDANEEVVIIDNRAASAWVGSTVKIKGALHITVDELEKKMKELPKNKLIVTYCT
jgi:hypothetical protein